MSTSRVSLRLHGEASVTAPLSLVGRSASGAVTMTMQANERISVASRSCSTTRTFEVAWKVEGLLSDQCMLDLTVFREWSGGAYDRSCSVGVPGMLGESYPTIAESWQVSIKAEVGASTRREVGNYSAKDATTLTVVRAAQAQ